MPTLDGYVNKEKLHQSARSIVYRSERTHDSLPVVLKFLNKEYPSPEEIKRFHYEFDIPNRLAHVPGINKNIELIPCENSWVIVMEDIRGFSLDRILVDGPLGPATFLKLAIQLGRIIGDIHKSNLIHKDINPNNIIYNTETGICKLIDFSLSTVLAKESQGVIHPNQLEGTLAYISPEQTGRMNRSIDYRSDLYSLGITFYEMLTGRVPFEAEDAMGVVHGHIALRPKAPHELKPDVPSQLSVIVMKLLSKTAEARYQSGAGLAADLLECENRLRSTGRIAPFDIGERDILERFQIPENLYGRQKELELLLQAANRIGKGRKEIFFVSGEPGIGKSVLVNELYRPLAETRGNFVRGKFDQLMKSEPYSAIIQAFDELVRLIITGSIDEIESWKHTISSAIGNNGGVITSVIPSIEMVIGKQPEVQDLPSTESKNRFNTVFQDFVRSCATAQHPLVLFIDDLQWADTASLDLIESILSDNEIGYFLFLGAYRNTEVDGIHPFAVMCDKLKREGLTFEDLCLEGLKTDSISHMLADTLKTHDDDVEALAEIVTKKTAGNPFFVKEFIRALYDKTLFVFKERWRWDLDRIREAEVTDNVVRLMAERLATLPATTFSMLKIAGCIGAKFSLELLSQVSERATDEVVEELKAAIHDGIIVKEGNALSFVHDKVREAALSLTSEKEIETLHYKIGKNLLESPLFENSKSLRFEATNHLNLSHALLNENEAIFLYELNMEDGLVSKKSAAYKAAVLFFRKAETHLLKQWSEPWKLVYEKTFSLYINLAEAEYLAQNYEEAEALFDTILSNVNTISDRIDVALLKIDYYTIAGKLKTAFGIGFEILKQLDVSLPDDADQGTFLPLLQHTMEIMKIRSDEDITSSKELTDPLKLMQIKILNATLAPSFGAASNYYPIFALNIMLISLDNGVCNHSASGFAFYGYVLLSMENYEKAYQAASIAAALSKRFDDKLTRGQIHVLVPASLSLKKTPEDLLNLFSEASTYCYESGNYQWYGYAIIFLGFLNVFGTRSLSDIDDLLHAYSVSLGKTKQPTSETMYNLWYQLYNILTGKDDFKGYLQGTIIESDEDTIFSLKEINYQSGIVHYCYAKVLLSYFTGSYEIGYDIIVEERPESLSAMGGQVFQWHFGFFCTLILLRSYEEKKKEPNLLARVEKYFGHVENYVKSNRSYFYVYQLMIAELIRYSSKDKDINTFCSTILKHVNQEGTFENIAIELYRSAVEGAKEKGILCEQAIANECAAQYHLSIGAQETASAYMKEARYCYEKWGCALKVKMIEERYPALLRTDFKKQILPEVSSEATRVSSSKVSRTSSESAMDVHTVIKASQVISSETEMRKLLEKLMTVVIENAGAERGALILMEDDDHRVEAELDANTGRKRILQSTPIEASSAASPAIIQYVANTMETLVLDNASKEGTFTKDPYIQKNEPLSVICTPIIGHGRLIGALYLENNLTDNAFLPERVEILKTLASQAAISIENARLVETLSAEIAERRRKEQELERLKDELEDKVTLRTRQLEQEKERAEAANRAKSTFLAGMSHELRTPLSAVLGYSDILNAQERDPVKQQYLSSIQSSGKALLSLVNDVLDLSKIESGRFELQYAAVSVANILTEIKTIFAHKAADIGLAFEVVVDDDVPELLVMDETRFRQVLLNLVGNAVKFTEQGAVSVRAHVASSRSGNVELIVEVEDTGKGISQEDQARIFDAFEQAKGQKISQYGGTGLGLAISQHLAALMNGRISVESELGKGSLFVYHIDNVEIASLEKAEQKGPKLLNPDAIRFEHAHVLIVDDIDYNRQMIAAFLKPYGFELSFASNGKEALERISVSTPHVILLDMAMPVMTGYELAGRLKENEIYRKIPIIAVTASSLKQDKDKIGAFCSSYLRKPVSRAQLVTELGKYLSFSVVESENEETTSDTDPNIPDHHTLEEIYELSLDGDMNGICEYIDALIQKEPKYTGFCQPLRTLAEACDDVKLGDILIENMNAESESEQPTKN